MDLQDQTAQEPGAAADMPQPDQLAPVDAAASAADTTGVDPATGAVDAAGVDAAAPPAAAAADADAPPEPDPAAAAATATGTIPEDVAIAPSLAPDPDPDPALAGEVQVVQVGAALALAGRLPLAEDFQEGDPVEFIKSRNNPMNHFESYKAGERGIITKLQPGSSVVEVALQGNYEIVESVLPLVKRKVPGRKVCASLLSIRRVDAQALDPSQAQRQLALPAPAESPTALLEVEEAFLRAIFDFCHPNPDEKTPKICKKDLIQACKAHGDIPLFFGVDPDDFSRLEVAFQLVAGREQDWISYAQLERLYRKCLGWMSGSNEMPCGEDPSTTEVTGSERAVLAEVYEEASKRSISSGAVAIDLGQSCKVCAHPTVLFGTRRKVREDALRAVAEHALDGLGRMVAAVEDDPFRLPCLEDGIAVLNGRSFCDDDEGWWQEILNTYRASQHPDDKARREGDSVTKGFFLAFLRENLRSALVFLFRRRRQILPLEDAIGRTLASYALAPCGEGSELLSERVSWEGFLAAYQAGLA